MNDNLPIIGIGASAGGLEALELFFKNMPSECGMAFVIVMHLDPSHTSLLPELLQRQTKMDVVKIIDCQSIEKNKIYVIPPSKNLNISDYALKLVESSELHLKLPIDFFFKSLAQEHGKYAACIILSGTGSDGTIGLQAIKAESGYVMVQSAQSAKYDGMPKNAMATKMADCVLPPNEMPEQLIKHFKKLTLQKYRQISDIKISTNAFNDILNIIKIRTGHDFSLYKKKTIFRRIERRMQVHHVSNINDYFLIVEKDANEVSTLFRDLLIGVTCFFRDKEAFHFLSTNVIPELLENKPDNYTIRVWVPGCSTGEEAYSVAILLQEYIYATGKHLHIQIFATDIDEQAIEKARSGIYSVSNMGDIGEQYCERYFTKSGDYYHVNKSLRETLVFATQNITKDPPFSKLDMICCRNLLIYFSSELQKHIFPIFHHSLKEDGILFIGPSETTGQSNDYFKIISKKWKIFKRKLLLKTSTSGLYFSDSLSSIKMEKTITPSTSSQITELSALQLVETILKKNHVPPCVILDNQMNIIYVHGRLGQYLEPAEGRLNSHILEMARTPELRDALSKVFRNVLIHKKDFTQRSIPIEIDDKKKFIDLTVRLLHEIGSLKDLVMVNFTEKTSVSEEELELTPNAPQFTSDVNILVKELENTRDNLQSTIEELETSNEELKSSNEELQSTNEELQSTNEELETSKEELQSLNEESITVNAQLQSHIEELSSANDDIKNLLDSTQVATVFLDTELKIRRFTPKMTEIMHVMPNDIGRPISHLSSCLQNVKLPEIANKVLKTLDKAELEIYDDENNCYKMRALPYRTANNVIAGVVISFEDITIVKEVQVALQHSEQRYKSFFVHCPFAILEINTSKLADYIKDNNLTKISELKAHLADKNLVIKTITKLVQALNINPAGLVLFADNNKKALLEKFPTIIDTEAYIFNQMKSIIENKSNTVFKSTITSSDNAVVNCEVTITVPEINIASKLTYAILVLRPDKT